MGLSRRLSHPLDDNWQVRVNANTRTPPQPVSDPTIRNSPTPCVAPDTLRSFGSHKHGLFLPSSELPLSPACSCSRSMACVPSVKARHSCTGTGRTDHLTRCSLLNCQPVHSQAIAYSTLTTISQHVSARRGGRQGGSPSKGCRSGRGRMAPRGLTYSHRVIGALLRPAFAVALSPWINVGRCAQPGRTRTGAPVAGPGFDFVQDTAYRSNAPQGIPQA